MGEVFVTPVRPSFSRVGSLMFVAVDDGGRLHLPWNAVLRASTFQGDRSLLLQGVSGFRFRNLGRVDCSGHELPHPRVAGQAWKGPWSGPSRSRVPSLSATGFFISLVARGAPMRHARAPKKFRYPPILVGLKPNLVRLHHQHSSSFYEAGMATG